MAKNTSTDSADTPVEATADTATTDATSETPATNTETDKDATADLSPRERAEQRRAHRHENRPVAEQSQPGPRDDANRTTSLDTFENPHEAALFNLDTATDANGVERIIGAASTDWSPAPLEASDKEKEAAERRNRMFDKASKQRADQLAGKIDEGDRQVNDPSQGGSQAVPTTNDELAAKENS